MKPSRDEILKLAKKFKIVPGVVNHWADELETFFNLAYSMGREAGSEESGEYLDWSGELVLAERVRALKNDSRKEKSE